jgi:hypothetical protein
MTDELMALAERAEALTGPCRETDEAIYASKTASFPVGARSVEPPAYTASLDAAMTLAEDAMQSDVLRDAIVKLSLDGWFTGRYAETLARYVTAAALRARATLGASHDAK